MNVTENQILEELRAGNLGFRPLSFKVVASRPGRGPDAIIDVTWEQQRYRFAADLTSRSTPKSVRSAIAAAREAASPPDSYPMIVVPYLSEDQLRELEKESVSGIDLSGNGIVIVPGRLLVSRTGRRNKFPEKSTLKNVYRGKVSIAARVFLLRPQYRAVNEIQREIFARGGSLAISTVSKVLQTLEEDLVVARDDRTIRLVQPDKLLDILAREYRPPVPSATLIGKTPLSPDQLARKVTALAEQSRTRIVPTGLSSVSKYAVMAREDVLSLYCSSLASLKRRLRAKPPTIEETERFANVRFLETGNEEVYFDSRRERGVPWSSPIQSYLELMTGDKRDRETAGQIGEQILKKASGSRAG